MASVKIFARAWNANHNESKMPKNLGVFAITPGYNVVIKPRH